MHMNIPNFQLAHLGANRKQLVSNVLEVANEALNIREVQLTFILLAVCTDIIAWFLRQLLDFLHMIWRSHVLYFTSQHNLVHNMRLRGKTKCRVCNFKLIGMLGCELTEVMHLPNSAGRFLGEFYEYLAMTRMLTE